MFYICGMPKRITDNQLIGELGEAAVRKRFLSFGFQFDPRSRLEAGIDGIAEIMIEGEPSARMIAVQVKSTRTGNYTGENDTEFFYLLESKDLDYWRNSNLPVILILYRESDESFFWKPVNAGLGPEARRLGFNKATDVLNRDAVDRLAALTVPKAGFGYYVPPLRGGETALVNLLPVVLPPEIFVATSPYESKRAIAELVNQQEPPRFDWTIRDGAFWSFHDPRTASTRAIVDLDQVEAVETRALASHQDIDEQNNFLFLLRQTLRHQFSNDLAWGKDGRLLYFQALERNQPRTFQYRSAKNKTEADVVNVVRHSKTPEKISFVRHHAFIPRFECLMDQWFLMVNPTYHFTTDGLQRHSYPHALLSGKKRLDNNASLRGQVIMWDRFLTGYEQRDTGLFASDNDAPPPVLRFDAFPEIDLPTTVPEDVCGKPKAKGKASGGQPELIPS